jgi:glyoxylase-like metal-dependent hydrolase (beta-lactamase superfamily II)
MSLDALVDGVYFWGDEQPRFGHPNAVAIVDDDGITVVDTLLAPSQFEPFAAALDDEIGLPVRRAVLTSSHLEFAGGTARFRLAAVYGSRQASAHLDQPADVDVYRRVYPEFADEFDDEMRTRPVSHMVDAPVQLTDTVAVYPTGGQMTENLVALVPGAQLLLAGAMCSFGVTPVCFQGDPAAWADALDDLVGWAPIIVPGHGPIGGEEEVRELQGYLRACAAADGDAAAIPSGPWDEWPGREHDEVNVERAALLARGDDRIPVSYLRLAGLA